METVIDHVRTVLDREFPGATANLEQETPAGRVMGMLIWDGFEGMDQLDRQRLLAAKLREGLPPEERHRVSILTLTNAETAMPTED